MSDETKVQSLWGRQYKAGKNDIVETDFRDFEIKRRFVDQDERFCAAMRKAILLGLENPRI